jgi:hypothetical protein
MRRLLLQSGAAKRVCCELLLDFILALFGDRPSLNSLRTSRELRLLQWALRAESRDCVIPFTQLSRRLVF